MTTQDKVDKLLNEVETESWQDNPDQNKIDKLMKQVNQLNACPDCGKVDCEIDHYPIQTLSQFV